MGAHELCGSLRSLDAALNWAISGQIYPLLENAVMHLSNVIPVHQRMTSVSGERKAILSLSVLVLSNGSSGYKSESLIADAELT